MQAWRPRLFCSPGDNRCVHGQVRGPRTVVGRTCTVKVGGEPHLGFLLSRCNVVHGCGVYWVGCAPPLRWRPCLFFLGHGEMSSRPSFECAESFLVCKAWLRTCGRYYCAHPVCRSEPGRQWSVLWMSPSLRRQERVTLGLRH
jgi:hypothetical protein